MALVGVLELECNVLIPEVQFASGELPKSLEAGASIS